MSLALWFHPDAEAELSDAADFYALQSPGLDARFVSEVEQALAQIAKFPEAAPPFRDRLRRKVLPGFLSRSSMRSPKRRSACWPWRIT
jgi:plasmid stabilization system protein ParE